MRAWTVDRPRDGGAGVPGRLVATDLPEPLPGPEQVRVRVSVCGVCRTDLHLVQGDLPVHRPLTVPGHEVVGVVDAVGELPDERDELRQNRFGFGDRVGIAWLRGTCRTCRWCTSGRENLCLASTYTGWDADGGYAQWAVVDADYAYALPDAFDDEHAAPLLCAGIIGYRALTLAELPPGGRLGVYGFGASAHLAAQIALWQGARVHVMTRSAQARRLALDLGCHSAQDAADPPPEPLDSAILFAPVGTLVPPALEALDQGGTLAVAGIHLTDIPPLDYQRHLFRERSLRSVTANTRRDGEEFLALAARAGVRVTTTPYPLDRADRALADLAEDRVDGAAVLVMP